MVVVLSYRFNTALPPPPFWGTLSDFYIYVNESKILASQLLDLSFCSKHFLHSPSAMYFLIIDWTLVLGITRNNTTFQILMLNILFYSLPTSAYSVLKVYYYSFLTYKVLSIDSTISSIYPVSCLLGLGLDFFARHSVAP